MDSQNNRDMLIGSDYYWDIISGEVAPGKTISVENLKPNAKD